jgi:hypothetical protein
MVTCQAFFRYGRSPGIRPTRAICIGGRAPSRRRRRVRMADPLPRRRRHAWRTDSVEAPPACPMAEPCPGVAGITDGWAPSRRRRHYPRGRAPSLRRSVAQRQEMIADQRQGDRQPLREGRQSGNRRKWRLADPAFRFRHDQLPFRGSGIGRITGSLIHAAVSIIHYGRAGQDARSDCLSQLFSTGRTVPPRPRTPPQWGPHPPARRTPATRPRHPSRRRRP